MELPSFFRLCLNGGLLSSFFFQIAVRSVRLDFCEERFAYNCDDRRLIDVQFSGRASVKRESRVSPTEDCVAAAPRLTAPSTWRFSR